MKQPIRAGFVQMDIRKGQISENLRTALRGLERLAKQEVRLAVLPEMWTSGFVADEITRLADESAEAWLQLRKFARHHGMVIVGSAYERQAEQIYNTATVVDTDGQVAGMYRKMHLFSPGGENLHFTPGSVPLIAETEVGRLGVTICYDLRFPELYRGLARMGAEMMVVPAQWPAARMLHWDTLLRARAIENQVFVVACNRVGQETKHEGHLHFTGHSVVLDPWGRVVARASGRPATAWGLLQPEMIESVRQAVPVWRDRHPVLDHVFREPES